jgi:hypothetical protein
LPPGAQYGTADAVAAAVAATFIKELTNTLGEDGPLTALGSWPL